MDDWDCRKYRVAVVLQRPNQGVKGKRPLPPAAFRTADKAVDDIAGYDQLVGQRDHIRDKRPFSTLFRSSQLPRPKGLNSRTIATRDTKPLGSLEI